MKKTVSVLLVLAVVAGLITVVLTGCGNKGFDIKSEITVITREAGSGTRGAFIELFGIEEKDASGKKVDKTIATADTNDSTQLVLSNVAGNKNAIGYVSLGVLNDTVKALKIDGVEATTANVKNGTYKISRPFNIATKENLSEAAKDFISFILSSDGQKVVEANGYIALDSTAPYAGQKPQGKIVIAGSSSVTPLMEKLKEAYLALNTNATIEIQQSDSSSGMQSTVSGVCDIGMASRELKDSETSQGLKSTQIALDGIAVVVNTENTLESVTADNVKAIYVGEKTVWSQVA